MAEDTKESSDFKVVDRRLFGADGTRRDVPREEEERQKITSEHAPAGSTKPAATSESRGSSRGTPGVGAAAAKSVEKESEEYGAEADSDFSALVSYLYTTAMFQLGLMQGPGGERIPPDLVNARRTIDLLEVLQKKTRGNLTPTESKLLEDVLYDLRITFVDVQEQLGSKKR